MTKITLDQRENMITRLVDRDIDSIMNHDDDGWIPYNQLTDEQVVCEYQAADFPD